MQPYLIASLDHVICLIGLIGSFELVSGLLLSLYSASKYRNDPKFSDKQVWANSADPDQTAPRGIVGAVWSGSSLFAMPFASF